MACAQLDILLPVYNGEKTLKKAVSSILSQSFTDFTLHICDDGSTDKTYSIISEIKDPRVRIYRNKTNAGLPATLNRLIRSTNASLIARADADDEFLPGKLRSQVQFFELNHKVDVLGTAAFIEDKLGGQARFVLDKTPSHISLIRSYFFHSSIMARRSFFDEVGLYNERYLRAQDKDLWIRGLLLGARYYNLKEPLIVYRSDGYKRSWKTIFLVSKVNFLIWVRNQLPLIILPQVFIGLAIMIKNRYQV